MKSSKLDTYTKKLSSSILSKLDVIKFLNFWSISIDESIKLDCLETFLTTNNINKKIPIKNIPSPVLQLSGLCYLLYKGYTSDYINKHELINRLIHYLNIDTIKPHDDTKVKLKEDNKKTCNIDHVIGDIDKEIDCFITDKKRTLELPDSIKRLSTIEVNQLKQTSEWKRMLSEITYAYNSKLSIFAEGYSTYTPGQLNKLITFLTSLSSVEPIIRKVRKPRKKKTHNLNILEQKLQLFNPLMEWENYKSVTLKSLFTSKELLLINTEKNTITFIIAQENKCFDVNRTAIINIDHNKTISKKILPKKFKSFLDVLTKCNKPVLYKKLKEISKSNLPFSGRINKFTLLLKGY